jgi:hypothetical protein
MLILVKGMVQSTWQNQDIPEKPLVQIDFYNNMTDRTNSDFRRNKQYKMQRSDWSKIMELLLTKWRYAALLSINTIAPKKCRK